jgi:hypothetical protein
VVEEVWRVGGWGMSRGLLVLVGADELLLVS